MKRIKATFLEPATSRFRTQRRALGLFTTVLLGVAVTALPSGWLGSGVASAQSNDELLDSLDDPIEKKPQPTEPTTGQPADGTPAKPAEPEVDPTLFDGANPGEEEDPDGPKIDLVGEPEPVVKPKKARPSGYPQEVVFRPLTLPAGMGQVALEYRANVSPLTGNGVLDLDYAVTSLVQLGLRYGVGTLYEDGYEPGKTFAIDAEVTIQDWIAAQLSIPILADPFAVGVTVGAPMRFIFGEKLRFEIGRDLVSFRTNKFVPVIGNALANVAFVAADESGTNLPNGQIAILGGVIYQHDLKTSIELRTGQILQDFELGSDSPFPFEIGATYAPSKQLDLGGRLGFLDLGTAGDSFGISLFARYRVGG